MQQTAPFLAVIIAFCFTPTVLAQDVRLNGTDVAQLCGQMNAPKIHAQIRRNDQIFDTMMIKPNGLKLRGEITEREWKQFLYPFHHNSISSLDRLMDWIFLHLDHPDRFESDSTAPFEEYTLILTGLAAYHRHCTDRLFTFLSYRESIRQVEELPVGV